MKPTEKRIGFERLMELLTHGWTCEECGECGKDPVDGCRRDNCPIWASLPEVDPPHEINDCAGAMIQAGWTPKGYSVEQWRRVCDAIDNGRFQISTAPADGEED